MRGRLRSRLLALGNAAGSVLADAAAAAGGGGGGGGGSGRGMPGGGGVGKLDGETPRAATALGVAASCRETRRISLGSIEARGGGCGCDLACCDGSCCDGGGGGGGGGGAVCLYNARPLSASAHVCHCASIVCISGGGAGAPPVGPSHRPQAAASSGVSAGAGAAAEAPRNGVAAVTGPPSAPLSPPVGSQIWVLAVTAVSAWPMANNLALVAATAGAPCTRNSSRGVQARSVAALAGSTAGGGTKATAPEARATLGTTVPPMVGTRLVAAVRTPSLASMVTSA